VAGYRRKVVDHNLLIAFPEKTEEERKKIAKKFYRNFTDNFIETIKLITAGKKFLGKHYTVDVELFHRIYQQGKKCQIHLGHNFNWEIANLAMPFLTPYTFLTVYMPINNKAIDKLVKKIRSRTGAILIPATQMSRAMLPFRDRQYFMALVADQNPGVPSRAYWLRFLGRPTPFVMGPEKGARANDSAVVFAFLTKRKRGYYDAQVEAVTLEPRTLPEGELTRMYVQYLEKVIRANPEMWLWTHRRWKHEWKPEYGEVIT
jgi:KDO2-lipid IV(A) lauroyltransferase